MVCHLHGCVFCDTQRRFAINNLHFVDGKTCYSVIVQTHRRDSKNRIRVRHPLVINPNLLAKMIPNEINKKIEQAFFAEMREKYHLIYTDYNDNFDNSAKAIHECMEKEDIYPLFEKVDDWIYECQYRMCNEVIDELIEKILLDSKYSEIHPYLEEWLDNEDNREQLRYSITDRDHSEPISEMIGRTMLRARVTQYSNYDALPTNWDLKNTYEYNDYFKDIVDTLFLNPAIVKKTFIEKSINAVGKYPNLSYRNGKEAVEYIAFAEELQNQNCYSNLVFMGLLPLQSLYSNGFRKFQKIIIPKGNYCGFYSYWQGGGSLLGMKLKQDLVLPIQIPRKTPHDCFDLDVDERNCGIGYCIDEAYGMIREAWGKEIQLVYKS
jgi:hypothetical protein